MKYISVLLSALMGIMLSAAVPAADALDDSMADYAIVDIEWNVRASPDRNDTVIGTIQDVVKHLSIVDPVGFAALNKSINDASDDGPSHHSYNILNMYNPTDYYCNIYNGMADGPAIKTGIKYLRHVDGTPGQGPGPSTCGRVSCSWDSAIWWCNHNNESIGLDSYTRIADGAQNLVDSCAFAQDDNTPGDFNGEQVFEGGWAVVVRKNIGC
ncbi:hypothetical protein J7T55_003782 [Diaporthe amygdali]|uniref:uncharacterized protein n=1 Tax=Phomopsis amygdali TaxID=1214568 RepID=UPI0022FE0D4C|nr:uncharacterized protein J7T55_003782 [Diaporthe amygdali]KAJ0117368.1 hypothetical protein J7T55_003782 [Diaporthe amygdali]